MKGLEDSSAKNHDIHFFYFCKAHLSILLRCCRDVPIARAEITLLCQYYIKNCSDYHHWVLSTHHSSIHGNNHHNSGGRYISLDFFQVFGILVLAAPYPERPHNASKGDDHT